MGTQSEEPSVDLRHRAQDLGMRALLRTARTLPYARRIHTAGSLARSILPRTRIGRRIAQNLDYVFPDWTEARRRDVARASADNLGRVIVEFYSGQELADRMRPVAPAGPGLAALAEARDAGRPVLLLGAHFGNYFAARACLLAHGFEIDGFIRPMANPLVDRHYVAAMEALGGRAIKQGPTGTRALLTALKSGRIVMMLNDLYVGSGVEMPFFGRPAMTSLAPAQLAARTGAAMIPFFGIRQPDGLSFTVEIDAPLPMDDPEATTEAYNAAVADRVARYPAQWFWLHRRWKRKWNKGQGLSPGLHPAQIPSRRSKV